MPDDERARFSDPDVELGTLPPTVRMSSAPPPEPPPPGPPSPPPGTPKPPPKDVDPTE